MYSPKAPNIFDFFHTFSLHSADVTIVSLLPIITLNCSCVNFVKWITCEIAKLNIDCNH